MTTTPETPALPNDLTYAALKLAALTLGLHVSGSPNPADLARRVLRLGIAAAGVAPAKDSVRCGGCRDLGPHRNVPGCDYYEPEPAPVAKSVDETIDQPWNDPADPNSPVYNSPWEKAAAIMATIRGAQFDTLFDRPADEAQDEVTMSIQRLDELCTTMLAAARVATATPSEGFDMDGLLSREVTAKLGSDPTTPSPDREKMIAAIRAACVNGAGYLEGDPISDTVFAIDGTIDVGEIADAALAVPPVVNKAKLAEIIGEHALDRYDTDTDLEVCACSVATEDHDAHVAAVLVERQREWLGEGR